MVGIQNLNKTFFSPSENTEKNITNESLAIKIDIEQNKDEYLRSTNKVYFLIRHLFLPKNKIKNSIKFFKCLKIRTNKIKLVQKKK